MEIFRERRKHLYDVEDEVNALIHIGEEIPFGEAHNDLLLKVGELKGMLDGQEKSLREEEEELAKQISAEQKAISDEISRLSLQHARAVAAWAVAAADAMKAGKGPPPVPSPPKYPAAPAEWSDELKELYIDLESPRGRPVTGDKVKPNW